MTADTFLLEIVLTLLGNAFTAGHTLPSFKEILIFKDTKLREISEFL